MLLFKLGDSFENIFGSLLTEIFDLSFCVPRNSPPSPGGGIHDPPPLSESRPDPSPRVLKRNLVGGESDNLLPLGLFRRGSPSPSMYQGAWFVEPAPQPDW